MKPSGAVILAAVKPNAKCRELVTWIITKLAQAGDKVVAVHVLGSDSQELVLDASTKHSLDDIFEPVLSVYQSICDLKQVRLDIKVVLGTSVRESLVDAANREKASKLVLAGSQHGCEPLAKYCVENLASGSQVLIMEQGHLVYTEECLQPSPETGSQNYPASVTSAQENAAPARKPVFGQSKSDGLLDNRTKPSQEALGWPLMHRSISLDTRRSSPSKLKWPLRLPDKRKAVERTSSEHVPTLTSTLAATLEALTTQGSFFQKMADLFHNTPSVRFTYSDLKKATSNFSERKIVGKGGCSTVYRGELSDGRLVAVKCLKEGTAEAADELLREAEMLASIEHPSIVTLLGYYADTHTHILVYNFASGGNLEENLRKTKGLLSWKTRVKIAIGVAEALAFLHDGCALPVIHRDVKSSNILLSAAFRPQLSDFGLAMWAPTSASHSTCSDVVGTLGYLAPEYFMFGRVNDKTDVFAFGVVLLELITGRPPIDMSRPKGEENLAAWARPYLVAGDTDRLVDSRLEGKYNGDQLNSFIAAASSCIQQSPQYRPRMARVLSMLCGDDKTRCSRRCNPSMDDWGEFPSEGEANDVRKHLALAMMGVDDDVASESSAEQNSIDLMQSKNLDDYLGDRFSRSSSFES